MIFTPHRQIQDRFYITGSGECNLFLLDAPRPVLFEGGIACEGRVYAERIKSYLGGREPKILFITHAHWDHCGAVGYLKDVFPNMQVAASRATIDILQRPNARRLIEQLNQDFAEYILQKGEYDYERSMMLEETFRSFEVDIELSDGQVVDLGDGIEVEVMCTPGHTRDHCSFYLPQQKIMIAGEAAGQMQSSGFISSDFISSYDDYLNSFQQLRLKPAEILCQGHYLAIAGHEAVEQFFANSLQGLLSFAERINAVLDEVDGSVEQCLERLKPPDLLAPLVINMRAQIGYFAKQR